MDDVRTGAHGSSGSVHTHATKISEQIKEVIVHDEKIYEKLVEVVKEQCRGARLRFRR